MPFPISLRSLAHIVACGIVLLPAAALPDVGTTFTPDVTYAAKAAFLRNCCHFIVWPESAFDSPAEPITICVFGDDPFGPLLDSEFGDTTIRGRRVRILRTRNIEEAKEAQLLFIGESEAEHLAPILFGTKGQPVVTVGETDAFLAAGGMIALKSEQGNVRLRINTTMVQSTNVTVSSKLLRIATQR